jgi:predicted O-methyltransferase YrrM
MYRPHQHPLEIGLIEFINTLPKGIEMTEIGCGEGESTILFLMRASKIHCVDDWAQSNEDAFNNIASLFPGVIIKYKAKSFDIVNQFAEKSLDLVYLDATPEYDYTIHDIKDWLPKIKTNGIIAGHDYIYEFVGVIKAVNEMFSAPDKIYQDTTWVKYLK